MMKIMLRASVLVAVGICGAAAQARDVSPQSFIAEAMRATPGNVAVRVEVAQAEIKSDINPSNIAVATGGGLFGALIGAAVDSAKAKKAEVLITPLRNALTGFDVDALAIDTTKAELADISWIGLNAAPFSKDSSKASESAYLDTIAGNQLAVVSYSYDLSPDFSSIRVVEHISIARKASVNGAGAAIKPVDRLSDRNLAYSQSVTSVVTLVGATKDKDPNAALWAADGGKRARAALITAFAEVNRLARRSLNLTPDTINGMNSKANQRIVAGGYSGRQVAGEATGTTLIWAPGFVSEQAVTDNATK
jgi:hypothetical protein